ncbi:MAG TPA: LamG domain-containing protein [Candidatus Pacearchaeota archaeon]|nr:LamG domain-containing protein [Candidatus Pacearchaeota archaeon]HQM24309.1 LamG domain-containing protein [Candidatus Pacearchaeota archaeon]
MNKSFTLIEILVVIVVIGVLSAFILVGMNSITDSANITKSKAFSDSLRNSLLNNIVSEWKLDGNANDSWGANNGTVTGATSTDIDCANGSCYSFNGSDNYIDFGNPSNLNFGTNDFSFSFWIKSNGQGGLGTNGIIGKRIGAWSLTPPGVEVRAMTLNIDVVMADGTTNLNGIGLMAAQRGKWKYIVYTFDRDEYLKGYLDGVYLVNSDISTINQSINNSYNFEIGRTQNNNGYCFLGYIDDVRIYSAVIASSHIKQNYFIGLNNLYNQKSLIKEEYIQRIAELKNNISKN